MFIWAFFTLLPLFLSLFFLITSFMVGLHFTSLNYSGSIESGFSAVGKVSGSGSPFSFYMVALLLVIFDSELIILYSSMSSYMMMTFLFFLFVVFATFLFEILTGKVFWSR